MLYLEYNSNKIIHSQIYSTNQLNENIYNNLYLVFNLHWVGFNIISS